MSQSQDTSQTITNTEKLNIMSSVMHDMQFPEISGHNLLRSNMNLPADFEGKLNIVFIAFQRWQQNDIDSWLPFINELKKAYSGIQTYELPVIYRMNRLSRFFINEGMRAGIPNHDTRAHTITLYTDRKAFRSQLHLPSDDTIYLLLVDEQGKVVWRCEGPITNQKATNLKQQIETRSHLS